MMTLPPTEAPPCPGSPDPERHRSFCAAQAAAGGVPGAGALRPSFTESACRPAADPDEPARDLVQSALGLVQSVRESAGFSYETPSIVGLASSAAGIRRASLGSVEKRSLQAAAGTRSAGQRQVVPCARRSVPPSGGV